MRSAPPDEATRAEPTLAAHDVYKIYAEGTVRTVALRGASLEVAPGELASLMGPSGSGKSTLLAVLAGLAEPSAGEVRLNGENLAVLSEPERARIRAAHVGLVFLRANLFPFLTIEENVRLVARHKRDTRGARDRARELLGELGLTARRDHRPQQLSGGEAQRAAIAIALANDPSVILGDEVTGELDSVTTEAVTRVLREVQRSRGVTMLLVTHNPALGEIADRRYVIGDGIVQPQ